jgi:lactoylglutathione lyase
MEMKLKTPVIELTYNWDTNDYEHGNAFGHIAIEVDDIYKACEEIKNKGVKVIRDPGPMMGSRLLLAFIEGPKWLQNRAYRKRNILES